MAEFALNFVVGKHREPRIVDEDWQATPKWTWRHVGGGDVAEFGLNFVVGKYREPRIVDEDWDEVADMDPQGDELDKLCDQNPAPIDWRDGEDG